MKKILYIFLLLASTHASALDKGKFCVSLDLDKDFWTKHGTGSSNNEVYPKGRLDPRFSYDYSVLIKFTEIMRNKKLVTRTMELKLPKNVNTIQRKCLSYGRVSRGIGNLTKVHKIKNLSVDLVATPLGEKEITDIRPSGTMLIVDKTLNDKIIITKKNQKYKCGSTGNLTMHLDPKSLSDLVVKIGNDPIRGLSLASNGYKFNWSNDRESRRLFYNALENGMYNVTEPDSTNVDKTIRSIYKFNSTVPVNCDFNVNTFDPSSAQAISQQAGQPIGPQAIPQQAGQPTGAQAVPQQAGQPTGTQAVPQQAGQPTGAQASIPSNTLSTDPL